MFRASLSTFGLLVFTIALPHSVVAQNVIVPDGTLGNESSIVQTQTFPTGTFDTITGGASRDGNLFHSFSQFNIGDGLSAGFLVTPQIQNIFARVTGTDPSKIQGTIGTHINNNGTLEASQANLFLLNPNGIIFGPNARLSLAGSFMATTASGMRFGNGRVFDAINPQPAPVLAVNVPLGLQFGQRAGNIEVNGATLRNSFGKTLSLLGGNVQIQRGEIGGFVGQINIGAVGTGETVGLRLDGEYWGIDYANVRNFQDIQLQNNGLFLGASNVANRQIPVGNLFLQGRSIDIGPGSLLGSIYSNLNQVSANPGIISLNASDRINLRDRSFIGAIGTSNVPTANIVINSGQLNLTGSSVLTDQRGPAAGGNITIRARDSIIVEPGTDLSQISTTNNVPSETIGGNISIETPVLELRNGSFIQTSLARQGRRAGDINVQVEERLLIFGESPTERLIPSGIITTVAGTPAGSTNIQLEAASGSTGDITIVAKNVILQNGGQIGANNLGRGVTGQIIVKASDLLEISGTASNGGNNSGIRNFVGGENATRTSPANLPGIAIQANDLILKDGGSITTNSSVNADSRSITIDANDRVIVQGVAQRPLTLNNGQLAYLESTIESSKIDGIGNSGNINIRARSIQVRDGGSIETDLSKQNPITSNRATPLNVVQGKAGDITIDAQDFVLVEGQSPQPIAANLDVYGNSVISSEVSELGNGQGGNIFINTGDIFVKAGGWITSSTDGQGDAGNVEINARGNILLSGEGRGRLNERPNSLIASSSDVSQSGNAGVVRVNANRLRIEDGAAITTSTNAAGDAGQVIINVREDIVLTGISPSDSLSRISSSSIAQSPAQRTAYIQRITDLGALIPELLPAEVATGNAGFVEINAGTLNIANGAEVASRSDGRGRAGDIRINLRDRLTTNNGSITTRSDQTAGGSIQVNARDIRLFGDSDIQSNVASGVGNGGSIDLTARSILAFDDSDILAFARDGRGGDIRLNTRAFFAENYQPRTGSFDGNQLVDINASGSVSGIISLPDTSYVQNNLNPLGQNVIDPNQLIAKTCIRRSRNSQGSLYVLGAGGLPDRPGDLRATQYPTGDVRDLQQISPNRPPAPNNGGAWKKGDPIVEPQGAYQLANGEWILSQECGE